MIKRYLGVVLSCALIYLTITTNTALAEEIDQPSPWAKELVGEAIQSQIVPVELQQSYTTPISRESFSKLLTKTLEKITNKSMNDFLKDKGAADSTNPFTDTNKPEVIAAYQLGIIKGKSATLFGPNDNLLRKEAAVMLTHAADALGRYTYNLDSDFKDRKKIDGWALNSVDYVVHRGIMSGVGSGNFGGNETYTVEQAIATLLKLYKDDGVVQISSDRREQIAKEGKIKQMNTYTYDTQFPYQRKSCCEDNGSLLWGEIIEPGTVIGYALETDTAVYIDGKYVKSYQVGDFNVVNIEDLKQFGYTITEEPYVYPQAYLDTFGPQAAWQTVWLGVDPNKVKKEYYDQKVDKSNYLVGNIVYTLVASRDKLQTTDTRRTEGVGLTENIRMFTATSGQRFINIDEFSGSFNQPGYLDPYSSEYTYKDNISATGMALVDYGVAKVIQVHTLAGKEADMNQMSNPWWAVGKYPTFAKQILDEREMQAYDYAQKLISRIIKPQMSDRDKVDAIVSYLTTDSVYHRYVGGGLSGSGKRNALEHIDGALLDKEANITGWINASYLLYSLAEIDAYPSMHSEIYDIVNKNDGGVVSGTIAILVDGKWEQVRYIW